MENKIFFLLAIILTILVFVKSDFLQHHLEKQSKVMHEGLSWMDGY